MTHLLLNDFMFRDSFEGLSDVQVAQASGVVSARFAGVSQMWASLPPPQRDANRKLCTNYLVAWYLVDHYPRLVKSGVHGTGGIPLQSKSLGGMKLKYRDTVRQGSGVLEALTTNTFGQDALMMIQSAPENYGFY